LEVLGGYVYPAKGEAKTAGGYSVGRLRPKPGGAQPMAPPSKNLEETLIEAVDGGDLAVARTMLEQGAKADARNDRGWTPLMIAAMAGRVDMAKLLVEKGADVNARSTSKTGSTVLCFATESDNPELLALLVDHGADVNGRSRNLMSPLYNAATKQKKAAASYLISHGARLDELGFLNEVGERFTPLMGAGLMGDREMAKLLLDHGANVEATNRLGDTALKLSAKKPYPDIVKLLIERGANVNAKGPNGHTALIYAAYNGHMENVKLLLAAGADPNATATDADRPGSAPYDAVSVADQQRHPEAAALITEAQARSKPSPRNP
jgi:ankyrin repeat protein